MENALKINQWKCFPHSNKITMMGIFFLFLTDSVLGMATITIDYIVKFSEHLDFDFVLQKKSTAKNIEQLKTNSNA